VRGRPPWEVPSPLPELDGNGGDDFTFTFPSADSLYAVFAFGFDILDNSVTVNETLSIYGSHSRLIGKLDFGSHDFGGADVSFVGFVSDVPIRYASFDESEADDEIGLAGFVFGYRESDAFEFPPSAWLLFFAFVAASWQAEQILLTRSEKMTVGTAAMWLVGWLAATALVMGALWRVVTWRQATLIGVCFALNGMLSADNLFVFMLLLQKVGLHPSHHVKAISHGSVAALAVRMILVVMGAALLQRFSWLLLLVAAVLLITGVKMLCFDDASPPDASPPNSPTAQSHSKGRHWAADCVEYFIPLNWSESTGGDYLVIDARGRLCATRMTVAVVGICLSDVVFAMDSVPAVLSLTTSSFILVASQTLSLLTLRALYFLLEAIAAHLDGMQQVLAVVLIMIACKIFLEAAGVSVPLALFAGVLLAWRVLALCSALVLAQSHPVRGGSV